MNQSISSSHLPLKKNQKKKVPDRVSPGPTRIGANQRVLTEVGDEVKAGLPQQKVSLSTQGLFLRFFFIIKKYAPKNCHQNDQPQSFPKINTRQSFVPQKLISLASTIGFSLAREALKAPVQSTNGCTPTPFFIPYLFSGAVCVSIGFSLFSGGLESIPLMSLQALLVGESLGALAFRLGLHTRKTNGAMAQSPVQVRVKPCFSQSPAMFPLAVLLPPRAVEMLTGLAGGADLVSGKAQPIHSESRVYQFGHVFGKVSTPVYFAISRSGLRGLLLRQGGSSENQRLHTLERFH